jgi:hypothetical protein
MRRILIAAFAAACLTGSTAALAPAAFIVSPPKGTLSATEYKQLTQAATTLKHLEKGDNINWAQANAACRKVGGSTPLLKSQTTSCLAGMATFRALANFGSDEAKCVRAIAETTTTTPPATTTTTPAGTTTTGTGTTTTGTTTTTNALDSTTVHLLVCLNPDYQTLGRAAKAEYAADLKGHSVAVKRGFKTLCLATLTEPPANLRDEDLYSFTTEHLAIDVELLTKVSRGQAPASKLNYNQLEDDASDFDGASKKFLNDNGPQKLSVCAHQKS